MPIGIYAELLQDATEAQVKQSVNNPNHVWQEKHNGDRRLIIKQGLDIRDFNRKGDTAKGLTPKLIAALRSHPQPNFIIDTEYVGAFNAIHVFDALQIGDDIIATMSYGTRLTYLHSAFDGFHTDILPIYSAITPMDKIALRERLEAERAEGFVFKDLSAPYRQSNASGTLRYNWRFKFWKTLDAVVIGDSKELDAHGRNKNSVRLGLYLPNGTLKDICGATKKSSFVCAPGTVVEFKYLYGSGELDVVQPALMHPRFDKTAKECTIDQIIVSKNWNK